MEKHIKDQIESKEKKIQNLLKQNTDIKQKSEKLAFRFKQNQMQIQELKREQQELEEQSSQRLEISPSALEKSKEFD